jgi:hypothetical protein
MPFQPDFSGYFCQNAFRRALFISKLVCLQCQILRSIVILPSARSDISTKGQGPRAPFHWLPGQLFCLQRCCPRSCSSENHVTIHFLPSVFTQDLRGGQLCKVTKTHPIRLPALPIGFKSRNAGYPVKNPTRWQDYSGGATSEEIRSNRAFPKNLPQILANLRS